MEYAKASSKNALSTGLGPPFPTIESVPLVRNRYWVVDVTSIVLCSAGDDKAKSCPLLTTRRGQSAVVILSLQEKAFLDKLLRSLELC